MISICRPRPWGGTAIRTRTENRRSVCCRAWIDARVMPRLCSCFVRRTYRTAATLSRWHVALTYSFAHAPGKNMNGGEPRRFLRAINILCCDRYTDVGPPARAPELNVAGLAQRLGSVTGVATPHDAETQQR